MSVLLKRRLVRMLSSSQVYTTSLYAKTDVIWLGNYSIWLGNYSIWFTYHDEHGRIGGGGGDDDLLGTALRVGQRLLRGGEDACALHNILCPGTGPVDVHGVPLVEDGDLVAVDVKKLAILGHIALELAVGGVVLEHVDHVVQRDEGVVDRHNLEQFHMKKVAVCTCVEADVLTPPPAFSPFNPCPFQANFFFHFLT
jgi:hypothetical protein